MAGRIFSKLFAKVINAISTLFQQNKLLWHSWQGHNKQVYTYYRPVSVLNTFLKIIELCIFDQLTYHANRFLCKM